MSAKLNSQHQAFNNKREELVVAIQSSVNTVADKCLGKGLITEETYNEVIQVDKEKSVKARNLLRNISGGIQEDPSCFDTLLKVLREASCGNVAEKLHHEWKDLENRGTYKQPVDDELSMVSTLRRQEDTGIRLRKVRDQEKLHTEEQPIRFPANYDEIEICTDHSDVPPKGESLVVGLDFQQTKPSTDQCMPSSAEAVHSTSDEEVQDQITCLAEKRKRKRKEKTTGGE